MGISFLRQKKFKLQRRIAKNFWRNNSLEESIASIADDSSPWKILAQEGIYAAKGFDDYVEKDFRDPNAKADWIVRSLANVLDKMANSQNKGLTMLSSIGATSPFVGTRKKKAIKSKHLFQLRFPRLYEQCPSFCPQCYQQ